MTALFFGKSFLLDRPVLRFFQRVDTAQKSRLTRREFRSHLLALLTNISTAARSGEPPPPHGRSLSSSLSTAKEKESENLTS